MAEGIGSRSREYTVGEEITHAVSHGLGLLIALAAVPTLIAATREPGATAGLAGAIVFAVTLVLVYLASTLYHAIPPGRAKRVFRVIDHAAIFLLIAGTYTPFTLGVLRGPWGWTLFALVWALCIAGVVLKLAGAGVHRPRLSIVLYLTAGWLVVIAAKPMLTLVPAWGIAWLLAGGVAYTGGILFYRAKHTPYAHLAWHVCVMAGTACHFVAVARYSA
jgi:hemolysin III